MNEKDRRDNLHAAIRSLRQWETHLMIFWAEISEWNTNRSPSVTGYVVERVEPGHAVHTAGCNLQTFYGTEFIRPMITDWRRFLRATRQDDDAAEIYAERLILWCEVELEEVKKEIEMESDKLRKLDN